MVLTFLELSKEYTFEKSFYLCFGMLLSIICHACIIGCVCHFCLPFSIFPSLMGLYCGSVLESLGKPQNASEWSCMKYGAKESFTNTVTNDTISI